MSGVGAPRILRGKNTLGLAIVAYFKKMSNTKIQSITLNFCVYLVKQ